MDEFGLGVDLIAEIKNNPEVVDLLISFTAFGIRYYFYDFFLNQKSN